MDQKLKLLNYLKMNSIFYQAKDKKQIIPLKTIQLKVILFYWNEEPSKEKKI
jgi:hypothetical protein